ncbi:BamA/TamA family outer membrane protein [Variovorax sp. J22P271]|uniref:BamA/TamA family outer membrane protein n=1 Tax=Variovorax davisae TaxID=3053515 RepID=UPI002575F8CA|nr:BamA/TamA family outer membrane protein [Variovorax sp. J22P271]MDM0034453.1 BamA/TamA family outer membrane protein [Variovorax sp. J22P271]
MRIATAIAYRVLRRGRPLLLASVCAGGIGDALAEGFIDQADGQFDIATSMTQGNGFLPIPIVISEPAVGYGGGVALMFVRNVERAGVSRDDGSPRLTPPDVFVGGAAATENGTKAAFVGGSLSFDDDRWRVRGGVGRAQVNLQFYGIGGGGLGGGAHSLAYSLDGWFSSQKVLRRIGRSDYWLGASWTYLDLGSQLDLSQDPRAGLAGEPSARRNSGVGLTLEHDSRDNTFTPSSGWTGALDATFYSPDLGGDTRFQSYRGHVFAYWPVAKDVVLAGRLDGRSASGGVPFYMLPFIDMRGIPAARYQDAHTAVTEAEIRWNLLPRWAAIAFIGAGRAWGRNDSFGDAPTEVSRGVGFRYLIARQLGLWVGLDYAQGPEGGVTYIQVGSAWR